jgi:hypothetical protein
VFGRSDKGKQERQRRDAVCDGKPRQQNAVNFCFPASRLRKPFGIFGGEIHHEADDGTRLVREPKDAGATHLEQSGKCLGRARQQAPVGGFKKNAVVGDKPCERQRAGVRRLNEIEREPRFAGPGWSADQDRSRADQNGRGVDGR